MGKKYIQVSPIQVSETFKDDYKKSLPPTMTKAVEDRIDRSSKLTTTSPGDKTLQALYYGGSVALKKTDKGKDILLEASAKMQIAKLPKKEMFAFPTGNSKLPIGANENVDEAVKDLVKSLMVGILEKQALAVMEK